MIKFNNVICQGGAVSAGAVSGRTLAWRYILSLPRHRQPT